jgi:hypothetical protein
MIPGMSEYRHGGDIGLHDHLGVEVVATVEVEVLVRRPGEAVPARVTAPTVAIHGEPEWQLGRVGHLVECGLAQHLVEGNAVELRRTY